MANINVGAARFMVADVAGVRPSKNPKLKSSLQERQVFMNVADAVMCVGIGGGDYLELDFKNAAGMPGPPGPPGSVSPAEVTQAVRDAFADITYQDVPGLPAAVADIRSEIAALRDQLNGTF